MAQDNMPLDPGMHQDTLDAIVREWARAKIQKLDILNHNGAMMVYNAKADLANKLGLSEKQKLGVTPFPSPSSLAITQAAPDTNNETQRRLEQDVQQLRDQLKTISSVPSVTQTEVPAAVSTPKSTWKRRATELAAAAVTAAAATWGVTQYTGKEPVKPVDQTIPIAVESGTTNGSIDLEVEGWLRPKQ